jgi:23S rRNA (adenine-N6)-dimethyltransferase
VAGHRSRWGSHQLDRAWAHKLVEASGVEPGDLVVDIGAGTGAITHVLVAAGARVVAVELHPRRVASLRARFADTPVKVVRADVAELRLPRRPFKVVANPPFGLTTALLRRLAAPTSRLECASMVLPAWAAKRWAAGRGTGGTVSKQTFRFALGPRVPATAFRPTPPADARVLLIARSQGRHDVPG